MAALSALMCCLPRLGLRLDLSTSMQNKITCLVWRRDWHKVDCSTAALSTVLRHFMLVTTAVFAWVCDDHC
jgi:hypothetical protein